MDPEILKLLTGEFGNSDQGKALMDLLNSQEGFKNKQLDQAWRIAELNESGANSRAGMSARASLQSARLSAETSRANAKLAAETQRYGIDQGRLTDKERLGLDYLKTASEMRGPENYLQAADFLRGASSRQDVPLFLQALQGGVNMPGFVAPGGQPAGFNIQGLMQQMGQGGIPGVTGPTGQDAAFLAAVRAKNAQGIHTLAPGALEQLNPSELGAYKSASEYSGDGGPAWSWDDLLTTYKRSGIGQGDPRAA